MQQATETIKSPRPRERDSNEPLSPERSLGYQLNRVVQAMMEKMTRYTEAHGVNRVHWGYMHHLFADDGLSQRQLSDRVCRTPATTVSAIRRMEAAGLVTVNKSGLDQRKNTVHLTDEGRRLTQVILADVRQLSETAFQGFSPKEIDTLFDTLSRLRNNLER